MQEWKEIGSLFSRLRNLVGQNSDVQKQAAEIASEALGIVIEQRAVTLKKGVAIVSGHPAIKNELRLQKNKIDDLIKVRGLTGILREIR